nr:MAG TPA: hypothetical protein [Caudoviricetes sp.]
MPEVRQRLRMVHSRRILQLQCRLEQGKHRAVR